MASVAGTQRTPDSWRSVLRRRLEPPFPVVDERQNVPILAAASIPARSQADGGRDDEQEQPDASALASNQLRGSLSGFVVRLRNLQSRGHAALRDIDPCFTERRTG